jgi:CRISPR-associated protein Cas6
VDRAAGMIDVAFALEGDALPDEHRYLLADALQRALPWLADDARAGVHRLKLVHSGGAEDLVSRRTRLTLRVPRERAEETCALAGTELRLGAHRLRAGRAQRRELLPHGTLYAWLVAAPERDEAAFLARVQGELQTMDVRVQPVCGRWQSAEAGRLRGCSLMLSGLDAGQSLLLLQQGLGPHRRLGCGLFIPHRSAAAVGSPS